MSTHEFYQSKRKKSKRTNASIQEDLAIVDDMISLMLRMKLAPSLQELEKEYFVVRQALARIKAAWDAGEMSAIRIQTSNHFKELDKCQSTKKTST